MALIALLNVLEDIRALDTRLAALAMQTAALAKQEPAYARPSAGLDTQKQA